MDTKSVLKKPQVLRKMAKYMRKVKNGEYALQLLELNYNNSCNFSCQHCFAKHLTREGKKLGLDDVRNLADQAHEMGVWQWHLQGGEVLFWDNLSKIIEAIDPQRFHIMITTNGYLMTEERAQELARMGVDKVSVSLDSILPEEHDEFRRMPGSHERAVAALAHAKAANLQVNVNTVVTRQNVRSQGLLDIIRFAEDNEYTILLVAATAAGAWAGRTDMLITEEDSRYILKLKEEHPIIHRDLYPLFDVDWGCRTMNGLVYITENGDLLSCPFIHISMGNVLEEPLEDILRRGWRVKYFRDHSPRCLAGEDREFVSRFMSKPMDWEGPVPFDEAFEAEDLYDE